MQLLVERSHAERMEAIYGVQRHVYDITRKYYLLGRDRLINRLNVPGGGSVLEVGCGTGRNLVLTDRRYRSAQLFGIDISSEMLKSARSNLARAGAVDKSVLAQGDATAFDPVSLFGRSGFDRVFLSYTLSMIPDWKGAIDASLAVLAPGGELHIVDFGQQRQLPKWFGVALRGWLARFHVTPRTELLDYCEAAARTRNLSCTVSPLYRDYAWSVTLVAKGDS